MSTLRRVFAALVMAGLVACTPPAEGPVEELAAARNLWEASGPASYKFEIEAAGASARSQVNIESRLQKTLCLRSIVLISTSSRW